ncbi:hypothetical protein D3C85_1472930 [compost metagenome]
MSRLRQELSKLIETRGDRVSRIISNVRFYLKVYKDFAAELEEMYESLIQAQDEIKESNKKGTVCKS